MWTRWSGSVRIEQVKLAMPPSANSSSALVTMSTPLTGSRRSDASTRTGSPPKSMRERLIEEQPMYLNAPPPAPPGAGGGGDAQPGGMEAVHESLHEVDAGFATGVDHALRVARGEGDR